MNKEGPLSTTVAAVVLALLSALGLAPPLLLGGVPAPDIYYHRVVSGPPVSLPTGYGRSGGGARCSPSS